MLGLMQDWPLLAHRVIDHAAIQHGGRPVISRSVEGPIHTTSYAEVRQRALQLAKRLEREGIRLGDRSQRSPGTPGATWRPGMASRGSARSVIRSIRVCSTIRSSIS